MLIRCESCRRSYDYDQNDGLCPKCGCYNNISDAQDNRTYMAGRYAPDCMEDGHDPRHAHTGGANLNPDGRVLPPVPKVPLSVSRTPVRDSYARKVNGVSEPARSADPQKASSKKSGCGILIAVIWVLFFLLQAILE